MIQRMGVNLLRQNQAITARLGQANEFLEPGRPRSLEMQSRTGALERATDDWVERELVTSAVNRKLEIGGETVARNRVSDDREVVVELSLELREVAGVIDSLVEAAGELR